MSVLSNFVQWILLIIVAASVIRLRNKVYFPVKRNELMHTDYGVSFGTTFPVRQFRSIMGNVVPAYAAEKHTILLITAPSCSTCKLLYPHITPFYEKYKANYRLVSLMFGEEKEIEQIKNTFNLTIPIIRLDHDDLQSIQTEMFPFGYMLSTNGTVLSKGLITGEEHLELLRTWTERKKKKKFNFFEALKNEAASY